MYSRVLHPAILEILCNFIIIKITISSMEIIATTIMIMIMIIDTLTLIIIVMIKILFFIIIVMILISVIWLSGTSCIEKL